MIIGRLPFYALWKKSGATALKKRRFQKIMSLIKMDDVAPPASNHVTKPIRILEVGCANGKDFIQFATDSRYEITAVDINDCVIEQSNVTFYKADAAELPFEDKSFDLVVSIGLLEHIEPMEKLCAVIRELDRVGTHQISVVPSISTLVEPHCGKLFFSQRMHRKLFSQQEGVPLHLNLFCEHTWTKFEGFMGCNVKKFYYLPPLIKNTVIYK